MRRIAVWTALVSGCALALVLATWSVFPEGGHLGELCGIAVWIAIAASLARWDRFPRAMTRLQSGAACLIVLHWLVLLALPQVDFGAGPLPAAVLPLFLLYAPAAFVAQSPWLIPDQASEFHIAFVLTLLCGAQGAGLAIVVGRVVEVVLVLRKRAR